MIKTVVVNKMVVSCDVCGSDSESLAYSTVKRMILSDGQIGRDMDICSDCEDKGIFYVCDNCGTLTHDDFVFPGLGGEERYCPDCAQITIEQLDDMKIRLSLARSKCLSKLQR